MRNRLNPIFRIFLLALAIAAPAQATNQAEDLFQKALIKETVERDPAGAIKLYQRVVDEPNVPQATSAESRLRMGICFEKTGRPDYAEGVYQQILNQKTGIPSDIAQQARTNLQRIETEKRLAMASSGTAGVWTHVFIPTRFYVLAGPSWLASRQGSSVMGLSVGLRYQLFESTRSTNWFLEASGTFPGGDSTVAHQTESFQSGTDTASLDLKYQASFGVVGELPHGQQETLVPEAGTGFELTASKISYTSASSSGSESQKTLRPYIQLGLHVFPDRIVSGLFQLRYLSTPYAKAIDIASPAHSQTFNFPSSQWTLGAAIQIKLGYRKYVFERQP